MRNYTFEEGRLIVQEMTDLLCLDMADKGLVTGSISIHVGYSNALKSEPARVTASLGIETSADSVIIPAAVKLYERIVDPNKPVRRINITCGSVIEEREQPCEQLSLFDTEKGNESLEKNKRAQKAVLGIKKKFGKNAILKAMNYQEAATTRERNHQIGGHKSGE
jgi:DNA polymerase V